VAEVVAQRSRIDMARAGRESVRIRVESGEINNLLPGARVSRVFVQRGDQIEAGEPLLELIQDARVRLVVGIPGVHAARVKAGTPVLIQRLFGAPADVEATVARVTGVIDPDLQVMAAEVDLDNKDGLWVPGLRLPVQIRVDASR
jgi:multidrug resistance efflux pump